jgi:5'-AMP-activated protein kinase regulatory gamma subunit
VSAPLWNSQESTFAGLLTASDFINVIKYYYQKSSLSYAEAIDHISKLKLHGLRDVERSIGASPPETLTIDPQKSLYDACQKMLTSRARRIPLIEGDTVTKREAVISVMTQYRILKFVAVNLARWTNLLQKKIGDLRLGTYDGIATASMESTIFDVISLMSESGVASIPIVDENGIRYLSSLLIAGIVLNVYEAVDVLALIQDETYDNLRLMVKDALFLRSDAVRPRSYFAIDNLGI